MAALVFAAPRGPSLAVAGRGSPRRGARVSHRGGVRRCRAQAPGAAVRWLQGVWAPQSWLTGPGAWAQQLRRVGTVAPWHVGSSQTRSQTHLLRWQVDSYPPFHPWLGNYDPTRLAAKKPKHETEAILKQT